MADKIENMKQAEDFAEFVGKLSDTIYYRVTSVDSIYDELSQSVAKTKFAKTHKRLAEAVLMNAAEMLVEKDVDRHLSRRFADEVEDVMNDNSEIFDPDEYEEMLRDVVNAALL